ncbi:helix-turn-helix transcriptional regulator [Micromonosporaceae bacterium Da 78-11]
MKADRLVATLLYLQARGRVTVKEIATELEVSVRTARRDVEALATAGVPVYAQRGRGGGWSLVGGARTDLTGLTAREIRALFLVAGPSSPTTPALRLGLRKLVQALPSTLRPDAEAASRAVVIDDTDWSRSKAPAGPHLEMLQRAVLDGEQVTLGYANPGRPVRNRVVHPLGLASKAGSWYLVAGTDQGLRTFRLSRVTSILPTGAAVERPDDFDLATVWRGLASRMEDQMVAATVWGRARPDVIPLLRGRLHDRLRIGRALPEDWLEIEVDGPSPEVLAAHLAGFGARVQVLGPPAARERLAQLAAELAGLYWERDPSMMNGVEQVVG